MAGPAPPWADASNTPLVSLNGESASPVSDPKRLQPTLNAHDAAATAPAAADGHDDAASDDANADLEGLADAPLLGPPPGGKQPPHRAKPFPYRDDSSPKGFAAVRGFFARVFGMRRRARMRLEEAHRQRQTSTSSDLPPRLSHLDRMTLSPWVKFRRFGRVPAKFILAVGVVVALTSFYIAKNIQTSDYLDGTTTVLRVLLGNGPDSGGGTTPAGGTVLFKADDLRAHLETTVTDYFAFPNASVTTYEVKDKLKMTYTNETGNYFAELTRDRPLGPLQDLQGVELSKWLRQHFSIAVHYYLVSRQLTAKDNGALMDVRYGWKCRGKRRGRWEGGQGHEWQEGAHEFIHMSHALPTARFMHLNPCLPFKRRIPAG